MTNDRSLERAARSWIEEGPTRAPDRPVQAALQTIETTPQERDLRVLWRLPNMNPIARLALVAVVAILVAGAAIIGLRPTSNVAAPPSPTPSPSRSGAAVPSLDGTFTSPLYGYSVRYPSGWRVTPATAVWKVDDYANSDRSLSDILGATENFDGTSTLLAPGESFEQWYAKYDEHRVAGTCGEPAKQEAASVDGASGMIDLHCASTYLETVVAKDRRVYVFTLWQPSSRDLFTSMLDSVQLGSGPGACGLITADEAEQLNGNVGVGAQPSASGSGTETSCIYQDGGGNIVLRLTYTSTGGIAAFDAARTAAPEAQPIDTVEGADAAVYDPSTSTLYVRKGDGLVAIFAGTFTQAPERRLEAETAIGEVAAGRMPTTQ